MAETSPVRGCMVIKPWGYGLWENTDQTQVLNYCEKFVKELKALSYHGQPLQVEFDTREMRGREKTWSWIKKGVRVWVEIGPRDIENDSVFAARRDRERWAKQAMKRQEYLAKLPALLDEIQAGLLQKAKDFREINTGRIDYRADFYDFFTP